MTSLLDEICAENSKKSLEDLNLEELKRLSKEIRAFLIENVPKTGGHLASNLGIVELTLALHRVFQTPKDKIIFDVGHQSYVHKILTGRKDKFNSLRQLDGISGFPKITESPHDAFNTGHASTSISAGLGMAVARDLNKSDENIIVVIGDGSMTGGMSFEALNHLGNLKTRLIIILNDNGMSISENIGGLSEYLNKIRSWPKYFNFKGRVEKHLRKIPGIGSKIADLLLKIKTRIRRLVLPNSIFEDLGIKYLGPIDGHDITKLSETLERAKLFDVPVLLHVHTKKGKGYHHAELNPEQFHGISKAPNFIEKKEEENNSKPSGKAVCRCLIELAEKDKKIVAITAAMRNGTGLSDFFKKFPIRSFDVGIAEEHAVTLSAGMAIMGLKPVVAIYSSFLQRAYDQIIVDVCLANLPVIFLLDRSGISGEDGETHHGIYDIAYLSHIPNISILAPSSIQMLESMINYVATNNHGPIAIRYPKMLPRNLENYVFKPNRSNILRKGSKLTVISVGNMLYNLLSIRNIDQYDLEIIDLTTVKPLDSETILKSVQKTKKVIVIEDGCKIGGVGSLISSIINENINEHIKIEKLGYEDIFIQHGTIEQLHEINKLDPKSIERKIIEIIN